MANVDIYMSTYISHGLLRGDPTVQVILDSPTSSLLI